MDSSPSGASVWLHGRKLGTTPNVKFRLKKGTSAVVIVKKPGYKTAQIKVGTRKRRLKIKLEPILF
jgi:hypothetical protein